MKHHHRRRSRRSSSAQRLILFAFILALALLSVLLPLYFYKDVLP